jgi:large conductance mechanosensitive channel
MKMISEFKAFILRGNVVDLAVGIVIGASFTSLVTAFIADLIMPIIALIFHKPDFHSLNAGPFLIGDFLTVLVSFVVIAAVVFFFVVQPVNFLMARRKQELPPEPDTRECPFCLSTIPSKAIRCAYCTAEVPAEVATSVAS